MFAYCGNNPVINSDSSGFSFRNVDQIAFDDGSSGVALAAVTLGLGYGILLALNELGDQIGSLIQKLQQIHVSADEPIGEYTVYFLCAAGDATRKIVYVGRVKSANFKDRMNYHERVGREFVTCITNLNYEQCRAFEQGGMMFYHTINRDSALNNQIRGIGPTNSNKSLYRALILVMINRGMYPENALLPISYWENLTENEFLNIHS